MVMVMVMIMVMVMVMVIITNIVNDGSALRVFFKEKFGFDHFVTKLLKR